MGKNKSTKFAEVETLPNVFHNKSFPVAQLYDHSGAEVSWRGRWAAYFNNENPLVLELACGMADYARNMATMLPQQNYIGVDLKGNRIWSGATRALKAQQQQVAFIRSQIELIDQFFAPAEVSSIWITFPDPQPEKKRAKKRLTHPRFLKTYRRFLQPNGKIHLKTDSDLLYEFTMEVLQADKEVKIFEQYDNLYAAAPDNPLLHIKTKYELMHLEAGKTIKYVQFGW
ncbi:MAG: tRNA (guanosine(46)-N7)-methyltransferase TrmB [Sphingobacteriales bacterium]|nr:tRNA (guanosine(46)-N7)-methyltransferase TrmB [Sphingobacteriales bacterium]